MTTIDTTLVDELRTQFRGTLLRPSEEGYDETRRVWNGAIDRRPGLIARCAGADDVVTAVRVARQHDLEVSVRGGGHSIAGHSVCDDGLMIDLSNMTYTGPEAHERLSDVEFPDKPEGPIAAAIIAGGIGAAALGLFTTLAEASVDIKDWLDWQSRVGPLSGKTIMAVIVWLVAWAILHVVYRGKASETRRAFTIAVVLVGLGVLGTFPTFFQAFTSD